MVGMNPERDYGPTITISQLNDVHPSIILKAKDLGKLLGLLPKITSYFQPSDSYSSFTAGNENTVDEDYHEVGEYAVILPRRYKIIRFAKKLCIFK